jgi:transcriptional regulator with XRE-family HTH domain
MNKQLQRKFGKAVRHIRKKLNISQERLAGRSSLNRSYISTLERNKKVPSLTTISALAVGFNMKPHEFIKEIEEYQEKENTKE